MKNILSFLFLVFFSFTCLADILEVNATNDEIRDAIIFSLQQNDLDCLNKVNNTSVKASTLRINDVFDKEYTLKISEDHSQPIIVMERLRVNNNSKNKNVIIVTTDSNLQKVIALEVKSYNNAKLIRINVGTILNPVYKEELQVGTPFEDISCK